MSIYNSSCHFVLGTCLIITDLSHKGKPPLWKSFLRTSYAVMGRTSVLFLRANVIICISMLKYVVDCNENGLDMDPPSQFPSVVRDLYLMAQRIGTAEFQNRICSSRCNSTKKVWVSRVYPQLDKMASCTMCPPCTCSANCAEKGTCCPSVEAGWDPLPLVSPRPVCRPGIKLRAGSTRGTMQVTACSAGFPEGPGREASIVRFM